MSVEEEPVLTSDDGAESAGPEEPGMPGPGHPDARDPVTPGPEEPVPPSPGDKLVATRPSRLVASKPMEPEEMAPPGPGDAEPHAFGDALPPAPEGAVPPAPGEGVASSPVGPVPPGAPGRQGRTPGKGRGKRRLVIAAAGVLVMAAGAGAFIVLTGEEKTDKKAAKPNSPAPSAWTLEAGKQLTTGPGLSYDGSLSADGKPVQVKLRVTRAGSAIGTLTAGTLRADVVTVDGTTYIKAGTVFWRDYAGEDTHPENYAGRWTKAPASMPGFDIEDVLAPSSIAKLLAKAPAKPPTENVNGVPAYKIKTARADYLLTSAAPYRLLSVRAAGRGDPQFSVTELAGTAALFAELRPRVAALGGAADPALRFAPGKLTFVNCDQNTNGCTVSLPASLTEPDGTVPSDARAAFKATLTSKGKGLGSCTDSAPVPSNRELVLRCTVAGPAWRTWMRAALDTPGAHPYEAQARVVGEALPASEVPGLLAELDRERGATRSTGPTKPSTGATDPAATPGQPNVTPAKP